MAPDYLPCLYTCADTHAPPRPRLTGTARTQIAIVGAGFTGCSAALALAERGIPAILIDAARAGYQASGRNGGQIHSGYNVEQQELEQRFGADRAHALWDLAERAKKLVRVRITRHGIGTTA